MTQDKINSSATGRSATRDYHELGARLATLVPGDQIRIRKTLRINSFQSWDHTLSCTFSHVNHLSTGLATDRVPEDDIVLVCVHFSKQNGELGSIILDDHTQVEKVTV
jgi:hypothetical protein